MLVAQSCLTLCNSKDCSPPGSSVHGILQARILEWVAMPSSRESSWPRDKTRISCIAGRFFTFWATSEAHSFRDMCDSFILKTGFFLKMKIKCALIFLNTILVENGDKKKQMQKNMGNLLKMCSFPQYPSTPSSCNTKLVQLMFSSKFHCNSKRNMLEVSRSLRGSVVFIDSKQKSLN